MMHSPLVPRFLLPASALFALAAIPAFADLPAQSVTVSLTDELPGADLPPLFLGISMEMSSLLPDKGHYYFDTTDKPLVQTFRTLGIKSLRVGADNVDNPIYAVPQEKDIDHLFTFARAAGVKVIYSFRLMEGNPADSARLASYIAAHYADVLDCFSIGNEPDHYAKSYPNSSVPFKTYADFLTQWKAHYNAILQAVPDALFEGPCTNQIYALDLAKDIFPGGHLKMVTNHYYFFYSGREAEKNPAATRDRFLLDSVHELYEKVYAKIGAVLAKKGVPYRLDELNSCSKGGAKGASDTYAETLWGLDCTHWWAAHHVVGLNYHTIEALYPQPDGTLAPANYTSFLHLPGGAGIEYRPMAYALAAFSKGAHGQPLHVTSSGAKGFNFDAYGYKDHDGSIYVTLINKSYGPKAQPATVTLQLPAGTAPGTWQRLDLAQKDNDIAAMSGITLGGAAIDPQGGWSGQWQPVAPGTTPAIQVAPTSATILCYSTGKMSP